MSVEPITSEIERQLRAICREEIRGAIAALDPSSPLDLWAESISSEIAADILRNFTVSAKGESLNGA